jgi:hypothetical protein
MQHAIDSTGPMDLMREHRRVLGRHGIEAQIVAPPGCGSA